MITRRGLFGLGAALAATPSLAQRRSRGWYDRALVIDGLAFPIDFEAPSGQTRFTDRAWALMQATGVSAVNMTVAAPGGRDGAWERLKAGIVETNALIAANPDRLLKVEQTADLLRAKESRRIGVIFGTQDTDMVGFELDRLTEMRKLGVRIVQLTYNNRNYAGDGALETNEGGLSLLGRRTVDRIEQEKLLLDLSHAGERTISDAVARARRPLAITHTGCKTVYNHPRNVSDANLRAVAEKGGVVGVYFISFLAPPTRLTNMDDVIAHLDHMRRVCGEDGVSIGSDYTLLPGREDPQAIAASAAADRHRVEQGIAAPGEDSPYFRPFARGLNYPDRLQRLAAALSRRGWSTKQLEKLFGRNLERLFREAWS